MREFAAVSCSRSDSGLGRGPLAVACPPFELPVVGMKSIANVKFQSRSVDRPPRKRWAAAIGNRGQWAQSKTPLVKHIQELIVAPSDQSARLAKRLREAISGTANGISNFPLSLDGIHVVSRLSVTLHDFATVQSIPALLLEAGLIRSEHRLAPCTTLADLEVVFDILDTPYLRMHYLRRRAELVGTTSERPARAGNRQEADRAQQEAREYSFSFRRRSIRA